MTQNSAKMTLPSMQKNGEMNALKYRYLIQNLALKPISYVAHCFNLKHIIIVNKNDLWSFFASPSPKPSPTGTKGLRRLCH